MSMSTGDVRRPSKLSGKAAAGDKPEADVIDSAETQHKATPKKTAGKRARQGGRTTPARKGPAKGAGGKGRKPVTPVKVSQGTNWGPIALFGGAGLLAVLIIGFGAFQLIRQANQPSWQERAAGIEGIS